MFVKEPSLPNGDREAADAQACSVSDPRHCVHVKPPPPSHPPAVGRPLLLVGFALLGGAHVLLSMLVMLSLGAGMHLSELMVKKLALLGGMMLWLTHTRQQPDRATGGSLPLPSTSPSKRQRGPANFAGLCDGLYDGSGTSGMAGEPARNTTLGAECTSVSTKLLLARLTLAALLACIGGAELWRLLVAPCTSASSNPTLRVPGGPALVCSGDAEPFAL